MMSTTVFNLTHTREFTFRACLLALFLAAILAASNTYLALKIGMLTSASIPAALLSMGILKCFKNVSLLEHNLVQTCASSGEAVAGGVVYTLPGLIFIHYWTTFPYWETCAITLLGGTLGILFSVPLRRVLLSDPSLPFPEGRAIAKVLTSTEESGTVVKTMIFSGILGSAIEFCQSGIKIFADQIQCWVATTHNMIAGFDLCFSPALLGAGYLIGFRLGCSLLLGTFIGWFLGVPILSLFSGAHAANIHIAVTELWDSKIRYIGIGAMLAAGFWTLLTILQPIKHAITISFKQTQHLADKALLIEKKDRDIPLKIVYSGLLILAGLFTLLFFDLFPFHELGLPQHSHALFIASTVIYLFVVGFVICTLCGYFSGMVGVSSSPGSAAIIAGMLIAALCLHLILTSTAATNLAGAAITIILGAVITSAAAITNDNMQDLKVGQLVGATPWKQQVMLLAGTALGALLVPWIMRLLLSVYGIGDVLPRPDMDPTLTLTAPPAALMAGLTQAVFQHHLPWQWVGCGAVLILIVLIGNFLVPKHYQISILGVATGIYLPMSTTLPLLLGALLSGKSSTENQTIIACGLVAGAALMNVLLAIPFSLTGNPNCWQLLSSEHALTVVSSIVVFVGLMFLLKRKKPKA